MAVVVTIAVVIVGRPPDKVVAGVACLVRERITKGSEEAREHLHPKQDRTTSIRENKTPK